MAGSTYFCVPSYSATITRLSSSFHTKSTRYSVFVCGWSPLPEYARREEAIFDDGASREGFSTILAPFVCIAQQAEYSGIIDSPIERSRRLSLPLVIPLAKGRVKDRQRKPKIKGL